MDNATCANYSDFLVRGVINKLNIRFVFADTKKCINDAVLLHDTDPVSSHYYGRALTTAILISPLLEGYEKYSLTWSYQGVMNSIVADVSSKSEVRGIIKTPHLMNMIENERDIYGKEGKVSLIKSKNGKVLNSGMTNAGLLDVSGDIAMFFCMSDQIETEIETYISFNKETNNPIEIATGAMLQAMPDCDLLVFDKIRERIKLKSFKDILKNKKLPIEKKIWLLCENILDNGESSYEELNEKYSIKYFFSDTPQYKCLCSYEKFKMSIYTLGKVELEQIFKEQENIKVRCEFCTKEYKFEEKDINLG